LVAHILIEKKSWFDGKVERRTKPRALFTDEIFKNATERDEWISKGGNLELRETLYTSTE
jgi:hypothetical protein